jgi:hypothetical protein
MLHHAAADRIIAAVEELIGLLTGESRPLILYPSFQSRQSLASYAFDHQIYVDP